ncbi:hypothetical protein CUJ84_Chr003396 [Rhizobium leguminosarum]|uniref:Uncharacterized protein n=1 Tax=Rhizobium leguminosarum TaxID=384 RepID=A0A2K9Z671_RHILE|nr:hypothetical protein CUJ84_Chr003396 [Rhizobium leguminosarum]
MRPFGRTKDALTLSILASCFPKIDSDFRADPLEQFQEKCEAVFRPELRKNKRIERFRASVKAEPL